MPQYHSVSEEVAIWWTGTPDFCEAVQALVVDRLGPGASVPALALRDNSVAGTQWLLDSRKAGLEVHDWLVEVERQGVLPGGGLVVVAGWRSETRPGDEADTWMAGLVQDSSGSKWVAPSWNDTWAVVRGVQSSGLHASTAVSTVMDKVLEEDLPWDHWRASQKENRLDHVLPQASARGGPRL